MIEQQGLITIPAAAKILGNTVQHARLLIREGKLKGQKIGRDWMVQRQAVIDYAAQRNNLPLFSSLNDKEKLTQKEIRSSEKQYFFFQKVGRNIEPVESNEQNELAKTKLLELFQNQKNDIPEYYLANWNKVALYHPSGNIEKANSILVSPEEGAYTLSNKLNHQTGKEWVKFSCSWFVFNALQSDLKEERQIDPNTQDHPATFSPTMISDFVKFFTKRGQKVLDPFCGIGSTMVACKRTGRIGYGIELNKKYYDIILKRVPEYKDNIFNANAEDIPKLNLPQIDFSISSPPYWNMLNRSTDGFIKDRIVDSLDYNYSADDRDLGNIEDYNTFINKLCKIYLEIHTLLKKDGYLVIIVKNVKKGGKLYPLAWDLARSLSERYTLKDEKIWIQDKVGLSPYGYPFSWVSNILHHYCIILQK